jgi:hypothetical protein
MLSAAWRVINSQRDGSVVTSLQCILTRNVRKSELAGLTILSCKRISPPKRIAIIYHARISEAAGQRQRRDFTQSVAGPSLIRR